MKNILIIEDDKVLVDMYAKLLANHGYTVLTAENGEAGLFTAINQKPDLILLDIRMPKMDGLAVMENLRQNEWGKNVPIIIFTNLNADDDMLLKVVRGKPTYYLIKSDTKPEMVLDKVAEVLHPTPDGENTIS